MCMFSSKVEEHYKFVSEKGKQQGFDVIATCLIGSQNYGLGTPESDVDTISIIVPSITHISCGREKIDYSYNFEDGGIAKVRDYRSFAMNDLRKSCFTNTEALYSVKVIVNPAYQAQWNFLMENKELIMRADYEATIRSTIGYIFSMESRYEKVGFSGYREDLGMNPKMFMHAIRACNWIKEFLCNVQETEKIFDASELTRLRNISNQDTYFEYWKDYIEYTKKALKEKLDNKDYPPFNPAVIEILEQFCIMVTTQKVLFSKEAKL